MTITDISQMSMVERLQVMEAIWDSLTRDASKLESPKWHKEVLSERKNKIQNGEARFISIEALKAKRIS